MKRRLTWLVAFLYLAIACCEAQDGNAVGTGRLDSMQYLRNITIYAVKPRQNGTEHGPAIVQSYC